jgi:hypothetical protein
MDPLSTYIVLKNVFTEDWCNQFISKFNSDELQIGPDRYGRYDFIDKNLAKEIKSIMLKTIDISQFKISHRFYMNKYWPDSSYIGKHVDGHITDMHGTESVYSVIIYLNTCTGGETMLYTKEGVCTITPQVGNVLLIKQDVLHEGLMVKTTKFILRTDLIPLINPKS